MFYSHEILANHQYGVATIWIVATMGNKSITKRVSKRAIEDVDLARACEKIIEPGAPIALRLQGSLLFGVSKVYQRKCQYMLSDVQKIQGHMMSFLKTFGANQLDPEEVKARQVTNILFAELPENLMIMDDPDFFPTGNILPDPTEEMFFISQPTRQSTQNTNKTSSQMSPHSLQSAGSSSGNENFQLQLDFRESSVPGSHASQQGLQGLSSAQKPVRLANDDDPFGDGEEPIDLGFSVDEHGNIIESLDSVPAIVNEPVLPDMPSLAGVEGAGVQHQQHSDDQNDIFMMNEDPLPQAEGLPAGQATEGSSKKNDVVAPNSEQNQSPAPSRRQKKKRNIIHADHEIEISRDTLRKWQTDYLKNCGPQEPQDIAVQQARENAIHLTFGLGIGNIGQSLNIPGVIHPLAMEFSGDPLFTALTGLEILEKQVKRKRGRPAKKDINDEEQEERRVRARLEGDANDDELQRGGVASDEALDFGLDQSPPEIGREAQPAMDENPSSVMPWNRGSSIRHGSSIQRGGSVQHARDQSSPLGRRGADQEIVRYSSDVDMGGMEFGNGDHHSDDSFAMGPLTGAEAEPIEQLSTQDQNQRMREALDREGGHFLGFVETMMKEHGERYYDDDAELQRRWLDFDDMFVPNDTTRATAAQAFYHVLTLVTKGQMLVKQDGEGKEPFGRIHTGLEGFS
ncbi:hypothetical protein PFICI_03009 [Pestalotiopsis fici W106-1]|uniref:Rad21/Rec8-like protein N-terminal domain-containing protein n=1 Tax=Pestalotiopsis fici (strain W106-1 / CGMCC3.15140) TaxID=1229662 RepID=W3XG48_PESFW|nr:uncharacterized protein PFICI_03009 [Pestalotiopsis fici W106-1]ETS84984.1 hypothetical protein PFICI_03009 [Pestalotiopsis fici W106-1]